MADTDIDSKWALWLRVGFRFVVCFFAITTLYLAIEHLAALIPFSTPVPGWVEDVSLFEVYRWATERLFSANTVYATTGGFVAYMTTALVGAGAASAIWSLLDWRRTQYRRAHAVLRIYLRYFLAAVALGYGAVKVIPVQFPTPSLVALVTPLGEFTRMRLLWHFMGSSTAYIIFTGLVEVAGGLMLLSRRTTPLGALVLAAAFTNVAVLNFGYEVGVQLNSTIYAMMALVLIAPDAARLAAAFFRVSPATPESGRVAPWIRRCVKTVVVVLLIAVNFRTAYLERREAMLLPALYGIYEVEAFERDGVVVPPGDRTRWQRLIIAERATAAIQAAADGRLNLYGVTDDPQTAVLTLTGRDQSKQVLTLSYKREPDGTLEVVGHVEDHLVKARLRGIDLTQFPLRRPRR